MSASSKLYRFKPFLDRQSILRVGGRWQETPWDFDSKHPILLGKHYITISLVRHLHKKHMHVGVEALLSFLRQRYWIIGSRRIAQQVKKSCVTCQRFDGQPCAEVTAPLPENRVNLVRPFYSCGIDYGGPLSTRLSKDTMCKVWIVLFVCAQTRAIHLEIADNLSTEEFILAFRRFVARKGRPQQVISDNATMFKAAGKLLSLQWSFIPPASPWFGGFYERLVKAVKVPLKKVLGKSMVWKKELETLLVEIENLVNNRPLTYVTGDQDFHQPLTPAMLMGDIFSHNRSDQDSLVDLTHVQASKRLKHMLAIKEHLANRWRLEYISQLRLFNHQKARNVSEGDVVLLVDAKKKRSNWSLGLVTKTFWEETIVSE